MLLPRKLIGEIPAEDAEDAPVENALPILGNDDGNSRWALPDEPSGSTGAAREAALLLGVQSREECSDRAATWNPRSRDRGLVVHPGPVLLVGSCEVGDSPTAARASVASQTPEI